MFKLTEDEFKKADVNELIKLVRDGIDVYDELEAGSRFWKKTFYEVSVAYGTPELVKACIEMGANLDCINLRRGACSSPPALTSSLATAIKWFNPATLRFLFESGANPNYLYVDCLNWHICSNILPEFEHLQDFTLREQDELLLLKNRLDAGTEILKILRESGFRIPGMNLTDDNASFYGLDFLSCYSFYPGDDGKYKLEWYKMKPEELSGFDDKADYYSEEFYTDGWVCSLPDHGSRSNALWHAVSPEALKKMIYDGADINESDSLGYTMLHHLAFYASGDYYFKPELMLQILIDAGADVNSRNKYGVCPLLLAAEKIRPHPKSLELVKILLRNGADFYSKTSDDNGILYWSCQYWYTNGEFESDILREIIEELGRETTGEPKLSSKDIDLITASFWGEPDDLEPLLKDGANINARTQHNYTPLMFASVYNEEDTVKYLIDNGASIYFRNAKGDNALSLAEQTGDESVIAVLLDAKTNDKRKMTKSEIKDFFMKNCSVLSPCDFATILNLAASDDLKELEIFLYISGVLKENDFKKMPFVYSKVLDVISALLEIGVNVNVNAKDQNGCTALMSSADNDSNSCIDIIKFLLKSGADLELKDDNGSTALIYAVKANNIPAVDTLIDAGADINTQDNNGLTLLMTAILWSFNDDEVVSLIDFLLRKGADPSIRGKKGETALSILLDREYVYTKNFEALRLLLQSGIFLSSDINILRVETGFNEAYDILEKCGLQPAASFKEAIEKNSVEDFENLFIDRSSFNDIDSEGLTFPEAVLETRNKKLLRAIIAKKQSGISRLFAYAIGIYDRDGVKFLLDNGADQNVIFDLCWRFKINFMPEADALTNETAQNWKHELDKGSEILQLLHEADNSIPYVDSRGNLLSYVYASKFCCSSDFREPLSAKDDDIFILSHSASSKALKKLLDNGIDVNASFKEDGVFSVSGRNILHMISQHSDEYFDPGEMITMLCEAGADVNARDSEGKTPLILAACCINSEKEYTKRNLDCIKALIMNGADIDISDNYDWTLHSCINVSCYDDEVQFRQELLESRKNLKEIFFMDIVHAFESVCKKREYLMTKEDADLLFASFCGDTEKINEALSFGANIEVKTERGYTPLMLASMYGNFEAVKTLLESGAYVDEKDFYGNTALSLAVIVGIENYDVIRLLSKFGADVNIVNDDGLTPLMLVLKDHNQPEKEIELINALISTGANPDMKTSNGLCMLKFAVEKEHYPAIHALLLAGTDITPLF